MTRATPAAARALPVLQADRRRLLALLGGAPLAGLGALGPVRSARAQPVSASGTAEAGAPWPELAGAWPQSARRLSQARFRWLGLAIYDIELWAPQPVAAEAALRQPLALALRYQRALSGVRIAERSLDEMARGGPMPPELTARWRQALVRALPDVAEGDRLTGLHLPGQGARFWHNGRPTADWPDAEGAARFFGIWLAPHTSAPELRRQLLGAGA
ncbi:chalcone isomerase family protein [Ideonella livida]|uniref:Chalcone isomerase domain-containing protein n=1 Tax=Ideonella livida TaxID=2707176 RepID=A0A7C9TM04_9BURK|nr:chalcone isomerase family protein [Ideonella livida]NDY91967.1 hypothetical protein [Ideonella livida]